MSIAEFLEGLDKSRSSIIRSIHQIIIETDRHVAATIGDMMGKTMILYHEEGAFKYALANAKDYMSLHVMTIYGSPLLHGKYKALLPKAKFQKGCINFKSDADMPQAVVRELIRDSAEINIKKLLDNLRSSRKSN